MPGPGVLPVNKGWDHNLASGFRKLASKLGGRRDPRLKAHKHLWRPIGVWDGHNSSERFILGVQQQPFALSLPRKPASAL